MSTIPAPLSVAPTTGEASPVQELGTAVAGRVSLWQSVLLGDSREDLRSSTVGVLAQLRRCNTAAAPTNLTVMGELTDLVPKTFVRDTPHLTRGEQAVFDALVLFSVHQQSRRAPMHRPGISVGDAVRRLAHEPGSTGELDPAVMRRFHAMGTATNHARRVDLLRALVTLLRSREIPLDYGRLSRDLYLVQRPASSGGVLLRWARDVHRSPSTPITTDRSNGAS